MRVINLQLIISSITEGFTRSRLSTAAARAKKSVAKQAPHDKTTHVQARQSPYPKSNQQRYPVPDFLVEWKVNN